MIFIGGIQPRTVTVDETPRICPSCGLAQARRKRVDHYLSLFFIPLLRVQKGAPFLFCERCQGPVTPASAPGGETHLCVQCRRPIDPQFRYCPHCGAGQRPR